MRLFGFKSAPQYENTEGTVLSLDDESGRWMVRFDVDGKILAVAEDKYEKANEQF